MGDKRVVDFWLLMATIIVLLLLSSLCIGSMFYFKAVGVHALPTARKLKYIGLMNELAAPLVSVLILILILCIPKRIIRGGAIWWAWGVVLVVLAMAWLAYGVKKALFIAILLSTCIQLVVLTYAIVWPSLLNIQKRGYWIRIGSPLVHLALLFFILDLYLYQRPMAHLILFWLTTASATFGMIFCFWADSVANHLRQFIAWITSQKSP